MRFITGRNMRILLGVLVVGLLIAMFYFTFKKTSTEGFFNPSGKYILLPITTQKDDIYNYPIKVDMTSAEKLRNSIYNHDITNLDKDYSKDDISTNLINNYYSVLINRLFSIEDEEGNYVRNDIVDKLYVASNDDIVSKLNADKQFVYRKSFNGTEFTTVNITNMNNCKTNPDINNCGYADGQNELTDYIVLKLTDNVLPEQLHTYLQFIKKYVNNNNITYKTDTNDTNDTNLEQSDLPFNLELTTDNMGAEFVAEMDEIPSDLYSLHQYYLMFIRVNKGILNKYPTTDGNIETRYNPLGYININYKHLINKLYDTFKAPLSVENRNNFNMLSNRIFDISIASNGLLSEVHTTFNSDLNSDKHRYHQYEIAGVSNCDYNLIYDDETDEYTLNKLNIGNTSALNLDNVRQALPKCGEAGTLFTDIPDSVDTAEKMVDISGGQYINIPLVFKVDSEVNPIDLYKAADSMQSRNDIAATPVNLFVKKDNDSNNILSITPQSYLLKLNNISNINDMFDTLNDKAIIDKHNDYTPIEDSDFDATNYPDFDASSSSSVNNSSTSITGSSITGSSTSITGSSTSDNTPTTTSISGGTSVTGSTTSVTGISDNTVTTTTNVSGVGATSAGSSTSDNTATTTTQVQTMSRQTSTGRLLDINGNPLSYGLAPGSSPGTTSRHQGEIISSPGFYTEQPNTIKNRVIGNIDDLTVAELHSHMHKLDPYFNEYSVPANDVSRGNIYVKDYKGNLNIFYPNIVSY
jgi:hypothetical protein